MMEMNEKLYTQKPEIRRFLKQQHFIQIEPSPPHTQALNDSGEHSEDVIKQKIIIMKNSFNIFKEL